jgi:D-aspartate ligase
MAANLNTWAQPASDQSLDPARRAAFPVAVINNDWAPTLAFAYSLGRQNVPLHFYGPGVGRWSRYCRRHGVCPPVGQADRFLPWLRARLRSGEITRLAPTTDLIAYYTAVLREEFPAEVRRSITPLHEIEHCLLKTRFSAACKIAGQLVPSQAAPDDLHGAVIAARSLGYPLVIKPKSHLVVGTAERGRLVHNEAQLRRTYRRYAIAPGQAQLAAEYPELRWPLLQRYVPSAQHCVYSVSGIKDVDRGILAPTLTSKREQWPPDTGVSTVQAVCNDERVLAAGLETVDKLLSCGIFELELLTDGEKLLAIDLNPRAFGFVMLDIAVGNDLPWLWWQTTLDTMEPPKKQATHAALECRFVVPYYFKQAIHRLFCMRAPTYPHGATAAGTPWISMLGHRSDPLPMLLANLRLLRLLPHRGGLLRPHFAAAWRSRRIARQQTP